MRNVKTAPGQTLDRRFLLVEPIGSGGMSTVWKARDLARDGEVVAVKVLADMFSSGIGAWSMFQREEEIGRSLDHPCILKFVHLDTDKRRSYLVTEYVPGRTLAARLAEERILPEAKALSIAAQICGAVAYLHEHQVVHYDLKPANVMLCPDDTIRLIDLGLAHAAASGRLSLGSAPLAVGTSAYVSPEQIKRRRGQRSADIYALGATLYEMLTGRPPFAGDDPFVVASARTVGDPPAPRALHPHISRAAEEIALRALRRDPRERYPTAAAMKADLDNPAGVNITGICDRLVPVTRWRQNLRRARYVAMVVLIPVGGQLLLFAALWWYFGHKR